MLLAALSAAGQHRQRQCMNAAPAKNAARLDRQMLNMIIKKRAPVNGTSLLYIKQQTSPWLSAMSMIREELRMRIVSIFVDFTSGHGRHEAILIPAVN